MKCSMASRISSDPFDILPGPVSNMRPKNDEALFEIAMCT